MQLKGSWMTTLLLLLFEGVIFLILSTPFFGWAKSPGHMTLSVSVMAVLLAGGFLLLKKKIKSQNMSYYFAWAIVVAGVDWIGFSLPIVLSLLFAIYFMWRILNFLEGQTYEFRWWLFFLIVIVALALKLVIKQPFIQKELIILLGVQTLVIVIFEALEEWRSAKRLTGTLSYLAGFAVIGCVGWLLKLIFPFIKWGLNELLNACMVVIKVLVYGMWILMSKLLGPRMAAHKEVLNNLFKNSKKTPKLDIPSQGVHHSFNPELLMIMVAVIIVCLAFYFFRKWEITIANSKNRSIAASGTLQISKEEKRPRLFTNLRAPKDPIRAEVFQLQKKLRKREEGRMKYETIGEWLSRLTKEAPLKATIQSTYEAARYGGSLAPDNQMKHFEAALRQVEAQLLHDDQNKK